ncbi:hypothetical protein QE418_002097 [Microbacterium testaceum]|uniref:hypothetical protein n=1 Tax=Microbacterium testaceum TaxID=2033 RepID=UPI00278789AA|nr:hypothetical protein [Microbacterium testaceum]MDQ1112649.1 hypothetical protein [Microbacterium testaceum]
MHLTKEQIMDAGLVAVLSTSGFVMIAACVVVLAAVRRSGGGWGAPRHLPDSELGRARDEIQRQIDLGRS